MSITRGLLNFFRVEIENERRGGCSPATLASAKDSLDQAPDSVADDGTNGMGREAAMAELDELIEECGELTPLSDFA